MRTINRLIIHCSATKPDQNFTAKDIKAWHTKPVAQGGNGWSDIGYHYVITRAGQVERGRDESVIGAHVAGHNADSIGICLVGGIDNKGRPEANFTEAQWGTLIILLRGLKGKYPKATIHGHNEYTNGKACPSFNVQEWIKKVRI